MRNDCLFWIGVTKGGDWSIESYKLVLRDECWLVECSVLPTKPKCPDYDLKFSTSIVLETLFIMELLTEFWSSYAS